ncbi:TPD1 protein-like protein 1-like [Iris pallida]|uniref:TPD1 protein-like protein 1-like n=1 Tax=Iris pallida TaxID=29817 RepID=A0AAX6H9A0_IRIPA|nr:TPD1 protein-like protein 1-like [Iris pallida]
MQVGVSCTVRPIGHRRPPGEDRRDRGGEAGVRGAGQQPLQLHAVGGDHQVLRAQQRRVGGPPGDQAGGRREVRPPQRTADTSRGSHQVQIRVDDAPGLPGHQL